MLFAIYMQKQLVIATNIQGGGKQDVVQM